MSRSQPQENNPNPSQRWFTWNGEQGTVTYYDKEAKNNVDVGADITFIVLDQLATVKGWHDESDSGIYSNEVKDTRAETLLVKAFKAKAPIAEGFYKDIKDRVAAAGGQYVTNLYIAFKEGAELQLGSIQFKGAALREWMEFSKVNRKEIWEKAVRIKGSTTGKKGKIVFKTPNFFIKEINEATNEEAKALDKTLQEFLAGYFKRTRSQQTEKPAHGGSEEDYSQEEPEGNTDNEPDPADAEGDDSIPF